MPYSAIDRVFDIEGFSIVLRRPDSVGGDSSFVVPVVQARWKSESGVDDPAQARESFKIRLPDLQKAGFPCLPTKGDKITHDGRVRNIFAGQPVRIQGEIYLYQVYTKG